ncbi:MAG: BatA domain-containing protein, partial [Alphaproteobacteria bacterium]|nr:BatA domain-containing protein [Alphaproteobacteria bacterium]
MPPLEWTHPWLLSGLLVLPVLWWFLRLLPPVPKRIVFPALRLVRDVMRHVATPAHTPWWLLLLRMATVVTLILGLADPHPAPGIVVQGRGDLLLIIDNDWAAARDWGERQQAATQLIDDADRAQRHVTVVTTATSVGDAQALVVGEHMAPALARSVVAKLAPHSWAADWHAADTLVSAMDRSAYADTVWIASGLGNTAAHTLYDHLQSGGGVRVVGTATPVYTLGMVTEQDQQNLAVYRARTDGEARVVIEAMGADGAHLAHLPALFKDGAPRVLVDLQPVTALRNQIMRFEIAGQQTAAATYLLDSGWDHPPVGIIGEAADRDRHSLLSGIYYLDRALSPYVTLRVDHLDALSAS